MGIIIGILSILLLASSIVIWMMFREYKKNALNRKKADARYENYKEKYELIRKRVEDFFQEEGTGKIGVIEFDNRGYTGLADGYVEVEEIKKAENLVKVRILDVSPRNCKEETLLKAMSDWMEDEKIIWVDGWEQKKRGKTIEDILDDESEIIKEKDNNDNTEN